MAGQLFPREVIERDARAAAEAQRGPQANPYPESSEAFTAWLDVYYAAVRDLAEACAA